MSCMILNGTEIGRIAAATKQILEYQHNDLAPATKQIFDDCRSSSDRYDEHRVYRKIYIHNLMAYNSRYAHLGENVREFPRYAGGVKVSRCLDDTFEDIRSYVYQISEDGVYGTPFYWAMINVMQQYAFYVYAASGDYRDKVFR